VYDLKKEKVADVLPGLLMLVLIVELMIDHINIPGWEIVFSATYASIVIALCVWVWVRGKDGKMMLWILITAGAIGILIWIMVMLSEAFERAKSR